MLKQVFADIEKAVGNDFAGDMPLFRGHSDASWRLLPGLARRPLRQGLEAIVYYDFVTRAGNLLSDDTSGWNHLFAMQHHGVPTRLLDWTTTFGVALYFATRDGATDAAIWILDPFLLNSKTWASNTLPSPHELEQTYYRSFIAEEEPFPPDVVAISPIRNNPRVFNQRAAFTFHQDLATPLDALHPDVVRKVVIPKAARAEAKRFLDLAGISEFSLFPDLDGLAREIKLQHL